MKKIIILISLAVVVLLVIIIFGKFLRGRARLASSSNFVATSQPSQLQTSDTSSGSGNINLDISSPSNGQVVTSSSITVRGTTTPNAEVSVNEVDTSADSSGAFSAAINLDEGDNVISVVANDAKGNFIEKDVNVIFNSTP